MKSNKVVLNETWIKASIIGTTWAASEIVLGSFLHNLKIPFSGNILAAIGIIILISVSYIWKEKGLFWRAGLICAIMKTMSPSAVIFGPMIAIFSQSLLLEVSTRLFGKTVLGFMIGAMLAMSWNLFQKIVNFIIFYGMNIVKVYESLIQTAQKQLHIQADIVWLPIIALLIIYSILGIIAALIGMKAGKKIASQPANLQSIKINSSTNNFIKNKPNNFNYSLLWLALNVILMIAALFLIKNTHFTVWSLSIAVMVVIWAVRYKRAIRQLLKPKFWIFFVIITMLTAFVFTKIQGNSLEEGLLIGLEMNFRAIVIIVGFSVLGTELYNPKIQAFFLKTAFKQLPLALEMSFESLPMMIAVIPDAKTVFRNPVSIIYQVISQAEHRLDELKKKQNFEQQIFIITGTVAEGKTTTIKQIIKLLKENNIAVGGFYAPRILEGNITIGYDLVEIESGERFEFLRINDDATNKIGKFSIIDEGLQRGKELLSLEKNNKKDIVVIDEIGKLELQNKGWAESLEILLQHKKHHILLSVRNDFLEEVLKKWNIKNYHVFDISSSTILQIVTEIRKDINHK